MEELTLELRSRSNTPYFFRDLVCVVLLIALLLTIATPRGLRPDGRIFAPLIVDYAHNNYRLTGDSGELAV